MPFCVQCGNQVANTDLFCARCGHRQAVGSAGASAAPGTTATAPPRDLLAGLNARTASIVCYVPLVGWLMSLVVLASSNFKQDRTVRFHAFQGLYLFVAWLLLDSLFRTMPSGHYALRSASGLLQLGIMAGWIVMLIKTAQNQFYRLPIVGELAERSVAEQA